MSALYLNQMQGQVYRDDIRDFSLLKLVCLVRMLTEDGTKPYSDCPQLALASSVS
jgi:hypothetical protein